MHASAEPCFPKTHLLLSLKAVFYHLSKTSVMILLKGHVFNGALEKQLAEVIQGLIVALSAEKQCQVAAKLNVSEGAVEDTLERYSAPPEV